MSSWAKVGAKCVCVDDGPPHHSLPEGFSWGVGVAVRAGKVYEIRSVQTHRLLSVKTIKLAGVPDRSGIDDGYDLSRFRPLITKTQEQDVSMFKSLLNKTPINETA